MQNRKAAKAEKRKDFKVGFEGPIQPREIFKFKPQACELVASTPDETFDYLWRASNKKPCIGCAYSHKCAQLTLFIQVDKKAVQPKLTIVKPEETIKTPVKTNAEIAAEKGISARQVSKLRKRGLL